MGGMEPFIRSIVISLADAYCSAVGGAPSTVLKRAGINSGLYEAALSPDKGVSARSVDRMIDWFSSHWPDNALWPETVPRPGHSRLMVVPEAMNEADIRALSKRQIVARLIALGIVRPASTLVSEAPETSALVSGEVP